MSVSLMKPRVNWSFSTPGGSGESGGGKGGGQQQKLGDTHRMIALRPALGR